MAISHPRRKVTRLSPRSASPASLNRTSGYRSRSSARRTGWRENERDVTATSGSATSGRRLYCFELLRLGDGPLPEERDDQVVENQVDVLCRPVLAGQRRHVDVDVDHLGEAAAVETGKTDRDRAFRRRVLHRQDDVR